MTGSSLSFLDGHSSRISSDDEKFLFKHELKPEQTYEFALKNARDIIAVGFKLEKTFIFSDYEYVGGPFYRTCQKFRARLLLAKRRRHSVSATRTQISFFIGFLHINTISSMFLSFLAQ